MADVTIKRIRPSKIKSLFRMMMSPMKAIKDNVDQIPMKFALLVGGLAFMEFFLITGLDLYKTGQKGFIFVIFSSLTGFIYGITIIPFFGILIWLVTKLFKTEDTMTFAIKSICLSYSGALIYGLIGLIFSLFFSWKVSIAFGLTGVLWAIGPMFYTIRRMSQGKLALSIILSTVIGSLVIYSWSFFGKI